MKKMILNKIAFLLCLFLVTASVQNVHAQQEGEKIEKILQRFVDAWRGNEEMQIKEETVIQFAISGKEKHDFHVVLKPKGRAELFKGGNENHLLNYRVELPTLEKIDAGILNSFTAQAKAKSGDYIPMDTDLNTKKYEQNEATINFFFQFNLHFWNREWPEKIPFGKEENTRFSHGANVTIFYYQPGLRSAWFQLKEGMHANEKPDEQKNPFPSLIIVTKGEASAKIGGKSVILKAGETYFIPPNMSHEFWAEKGQYLEGILLMFGNGA